MNEQACELRPRFDGRAGMLRALGNRTQQRLRRLEVSAILQRSGARKIERGYIDDGSVHGERMRMRSGKTSESIAMMIWRSR